MDQPFDHFGEAMAILAAFIFAWTSVLFTNAGHRLGVTTVNLLRLPGAAVCLAVVHLVLTGRPWPVGLDGVDHFWIGLSGVVGLAAGDSALFKAFSTIGPRRSMTMMALAPVFTTVIAWVVLGEHLNLWAILGIATVIAGIITTTRGRDGTGGRFGNIAPATLRSGLLLAVAASAGQGLGSVFAKMGMTGAVSAGGGVDPLGATLVRVVWAAVFYWLALLPRLRITERARRLQDRRGLAYLAAAVLLGPVISVWISQVAIRHTEAGVAQVFLGMVPIFVIAPAWLVYRDRPGILSLFGVVLAVGGGALLFLR